MNSEVQAVPVQILLVEDNPGDIELTIEALSSNKICNELVIARDGEEALNILNREGKYRNAKKPDIIILDLNLPKIDGREVLKQIKNDLELKQIPVVILTTSQAEEDILSSYEYHANCFISKPIDLEQFVKVVKAIDDFWLGVVKLPKINYGN